MMTLVEKMLPVLVLRQVWGTGTGTGTAGDTAPTITLNGSATVTHELGDIYTDLAQQLLTTMIQMLLL